jgi:hypothetical protein
MSSTFMEPHYKCFEVDDGSTGYWEVYYSDGVADLHYMSVIELEELGDWISAVRERTTLDVKVALNYSDVESWEGMKI